MLETEDEFLRKLSQIAERCSRYKREAYLFIYAALEHTVQSLKRNRAELPEGRHVTGQELAQGIAEYARQQYGPMARTVFDHWGIHETLDFGRIVFSLVDQGLMGKTEQDSLEDFQDVYDFNDMFDPKRIQSSLDRIDPERL